MTMRLCHSCGSRTTICCDVFNRWMCQSCAKTWLTHIADIIGTADGQAWCHKEITEGTMLVLSRHVGQSIVIDGGIVVTVLSIQGDRIRLGVEAPEAIKVLRSELQRNETDGWNPNE